MPGSWVFEALVLVLVEDRVSSLVESSSLSC